MNEQEAMARMVAPGQLRSSKPYRGGVIQIHLTRSCDKSCFGCTQGSNLAGKTSFMSLDHFEEALTSLQGYWGVVGLFGGNPALHPEFEAICLLLRKYIPFEQRGIWSNNPLGKGKMMRETFNPRYSNLNVHLDQKAYDEFRRDWPESIVVGLHQDSRHSPPWVAMKDVDKLPVFDANHNLIGTMENTEENRYNLITDCDINQRWSAMIGVFRGKLRAWFCEVAGAQSIMHQDDTNHQVERDDCPANTDRWLRKSPDQVEGKCDCYTYPDTGLPVACECNGTHYIDTTTEHNKEWRTKIPCYCTHNLQWWELGISSFAHQVRKHCHECGIPLRGYGELAQQSSQDAQEQVSKTHQAIYRPKRTSRRVELVMRLDQMHTGKITRSTDYLQNANK